MFNFVFIAAFSCYGKPETKQDGTTIKYVDPNSLNHWYECLGGIAKRYGCSWGLQFDKVLQYCRKPQTVVPTEGKPYI